MESSIAATERHWQTRLCYTYIERDEDRRPPSPEQQRKEKEKLDKLKGGMPDQRAARFSKEKEETTSLVQEVPKAFDSQLLGEEVVGGRRAYVLQATPHPGYQAQGRYDKMFAKLEGKLWVDKQDFRWIKDDGEIIQPFSIGLFLGRVLRGSHITMEQTRVDGGIWIPEHVEIRAAAKIFFIKSLVIDRTLTYSEYRMAHAGGPSTGDPAIP